MVYGELTKELMNQYPNMNVLFCIMTSHLEVLGADKTEIDQYRQEYARLAKELGIRYDSSALRDITLRIISSL
jgi:hypothetical protein